jgi:hypothetical protein
MKTLFAWITRHADEAGPLAFIVVSLAVLGLASMLYFGAPQAVDVIENAPAIPEELADHQERGDLERGRSVGATPSTALPRPDAFLAQSGIDYAFKGSPNWSGRGTCAPQAIVLHVTGPGSMAGMASWFNNPSAQVSANLGIGKKGEVQQYVELGDASWHAGIINRPNLDNPLIAEWVRTGVNPNRCTIGIELLLGGPAEPLSDYPAMEKTLLTLLPWLLATTGIPADRVHVIGHYEIDSINRATDPRCCVNIDSLLTKIAGPAPLPVEWTDCDAAWGGWWNVTIRRWVSPGSSLFDPVTGVWSSPPPCGS